MPTRSQHPNQHVFSTAGAFGRHSTGHKSVDESADGASAGGTSPPRRVSATTVVIATKAQIHSPTSATRAVGFRTASRAPPRNGRTKPWERVVGSGDGKRASAAAIVASTATPEAHSGAAVVPMNRTAPPISKPAWIPTISATAKTTYAVGGRNRAA